MERAALEARLARLVEAVLPTDEVVDFLNTMARKLISEATWDSLPAVWREDTLGRSIEELRLYGWLEEEEGVRDEEEEVLPVHRAGLRNLARAARVLGLSKERRPDAPAGIGRLPAAARVGMTPKKVHECELFPPLVAEAARGADVCLDVGCGNGYFSLVCAQLLGVPMVGLEGGDAMLEEKQFQTRLRLLQQEPLQRGERKHVPSFRRAALEDGTSVAAFRAQAGVGPKQRTALAGLHCCGQLSVNVLRLFLEDPQCRGLALVGCCYGRFGSLGHAMSFPVSRWGRAAPRLLRLGTGAMRAATESPHLRRQESRAAYDRGLLLLLYRLLSEQILERELGPGRFRCERKVRKSCGSFAEYFRELLRGLRAERSVEGDDAAWNAEFARLHTPETAHRVAAQLALRGSFATLLESIVVLDRVLWLLETDPTLAVGAFACFDPAVSPTNLVLVARKPD